MNCWTVGAEITPIPLSPAAVTGRPENCHKPPGKASSEGNQMKEHVCQAHHRITAQNHRAAPPLCSSRAGTAQGRAGYRWLQGRAGPGTGIPRGRVHPELAQQTLSSASRGTKRAEASRALPSARALGSHPAAPSPALLSTHSAPAIGNFPPWAAVPHLSKDRTG